MVGLRRRDAGGRRPRRPGVAPAARSRAGLGAWSAATALTGTASGFASLAAWRAVVGVGEATLPPTALSMIGDRFPPARVGFANGLYYAGIPTGFALSFALAGAVAPRFGWRACFLVLGVAGLVAVALVWRMADPPRRGARAPRARAGPAPRLRAALRALAGRPAAAPHDPGTRPCSSTRARPSQHTITWLVQERGFAFPRAAFLLGGDHPRRRPRRQPRHRRAHRPRAAPAPGGSARRPRRPGRPRPRLHRSRSTALPVASPALPPRVVPRPGVAARLVRAGRRAAIDEMAPPGLRASVIGLGPAGRQPRGRRVAGPTSPASSATARA